MSKSSHETQGTADGLCGLYCVLNVLRDWEEIPNRNESPGVTAFRFILEATENLGFLTANRVIDGYEWFELKDIFNRVSASLEYPHRAISMREALGRCVTGSGIEKVRHLISKESFRFILAVDRGKHWILADGLKRDSSIIVKDPFRDSERKSITSLHDNWQGLAIVPHNWTANAQTH